jgi:hypothetical protein
MNGTKQRQHAATLERFLATPRVRVLELDRQTTRTFGGDRNSAPARHGGKRPLLGLA